MPGATQTSRRGSRLRHAGAVLGVSALIISAATAAAAQPAATVAAAHAAATVGGTRPITVIIHEPTGVTTGPVPQVPTPTTPPAGSPTTPPSGTKTPRPKPRPKPKTPTAAQVVGLQSAKPCISSLRVALARPDSVHLRALSIFIGGRHVTRTPPPKAITFHQLPKGDFTLRVTVTTTSGAHLTLARTYRPCR
ncbi:MAG TPA: hypothetical protein VIJ51_16030 [Solirubrobacteraceae bacterium]